MLSKSEVKKKNNPEPPEITQAIVMEMTAGREATWDSLAPYALHIMRVADNGPTEAGDYELVIHCLRAAFSELTTRLAIERFALIAWRAGECKPEPEPEQKDETDAVEPDEKD